MKLRQVIALARLWADDPEVAGNPVSIVDSTAANPSNIQSIRHGFVTGQEVIISGHSDAGLNGTHVATVIDIDNFTIPVLGSGGTGGTVIGTSGKSLFSTPELVTYANLAVRDACIRMPLIVDNYTKSVTEISVIEGEKEYRLHEAILDIRDLTLDDDYIPHWNAFDKRKGFTTQAYIVDLRSRRLSLNAEPADDGTIKMAVQRLPLCDYGLDDELEFDQVAHEPIAHGILSRGYMKKDTELFSQDESDQHAARFTEFFGEVTSYRETIINLENPPKRASASINYFC